MTASTRSELQTRVVTAAALIIVLLGLVSLAAFTAVGRFALLGGVFVLLGLCAFEAARLLGRDSSDRPDPVLGTLSFICVVLPIIIAFLFNAVDPQAPCNFALINIACLPAMFLITVIGRKDLEAAKDLTAVFAPALLLVGICGAALISLAGQRHGYSYGIWLVTVVALNDTAAYFGGKKIGGPKLAPAISPNKTIAGSIIGLAVGTIAGLCTWTLLISSNTDLFSITFYSMIVVLSAQVGDLVKSFIKRLKNVKDTGNILPGHGGVLDRMDGFIGGGAALYGILFGLLGA